MPLEPVPGDVIRYDFLWKDEQKDGHNEGLKDRPCLILSVKPGGSEGERDVMVIPITHLPPKENEKAVEIPYKMARHLTLDHDRMWIKSHELNTIVWDNHYTPGGVVPVQPNQPIYGRMHKTLVKEAYNQVQENYRTRGLSNVRREPDPYIKEVMDAQREARAAREANRTNGDDGNSR